MVFASRVGVRYVLPVTSVESRTLLVCWAIAESSVYASSIGSPGAPMPGSW